ncbi:hypothetical protein [Delftia lacustris]|uniref:hypothetical protein n=1 Tax=Delftia lacustris TaxID=558537 RepID=UPI000AA6A87E|nr:hypothetical protein [Delftia lacustris]
MYMPGEKHPARGSLVIANAAVLRKCKNHIHLEFKEIAVPSMKSRRRARFYVMRRNYRNLWRELENNQRLAMRLNGWI